MAQDILSDAFAREVAAALRERFGIGHATIQIETAAEAELCWLRPGDRV